MRRIIRDEAVYLSDFAFIQHLHLIFFHMFVKSWISKFCSLEGCQRPSNENPLRRIPRTMA